VAEWEDGTDARPGEAFGAACAASSSSEDIFGPVVVIGGLRGGSRSREHGYGTT
jgi:hypothetical protein